MPYQSPTLSELIKQGEQQLQQHFPHLKRHAVVKVLNRVMAALSASEHIHLDWLAKQIIPTSADEDYLLEYCAYKGISRKPATVATGVIRVEAVRGLELPTNTLFQHSSTGLLFSTLNNEHLSEGEHQIAVQCTSEGAEGNLPVGDELRLTSAVLGLKPKGTIVSMSGGSDIEPLSQLLSRLIYRVQYPPAGGAAHDYVRWATEVTGITRAWCYPRWQGGGTVGVAVVCDERADILPTEEDLTRVKDYIRGHRNETTGLWEGMPANVELFVFAPEIQAIDFKIRVYPDSTDLRLAVVQSLRSYLLKTEIGSRLYLSQLRAAISNTVGEIDNSIIFPAEDVFLPSNCIPVLGEVQWQ